MNSTLGSVVPLAMFSCHDLIFSCPPRDRKRTNRYPCIIGLHCSVTRLLDLTLSWGVSMPSHVSIPLACLLLSLDRARSYGRCNNPTGFLTPLQACDQPRSISLIHYGVIYGRQYFMFLDLTIVLP